MTTHRTPDLSVRWGVTCKTCQSPAFVVVGPRPSISDVITVERCQHLDGRPLSVTDSLDCDSCGTPYAPGGVEPSTKWVRLDVQCPVCLCQWPTPAGLEAHQCVHGTRCQDDPGWHDDFVRFGRHGDARDIAAVRAAISAIQSSRQPRGRPKKT